MAIENSYHHGDLRAALLDRAEAALRLNPRQLPSIRALAAELGVSATAPHAHFRTKSDLLAALAARGFDRTTILSGGESVSRSVLRRVLELGRGLVTTSEEGKDLIEELTSHITKPAFTYIHKWQPGDVVLWDNRCTQHCAIPYDDSVEDRHMLRTTLEGDVPFYLAADGSRVESSLA